MSFEDLKKGMKARVIGLHDENPESVRLQEMGLTVGTTFQVVKVAPFGDPVEIDVRGYRLCLRKRETGDFEVEPIG
jgi:ferrous iron transport protein A